MNNGNTTESEGPLRIIKKYPNRRLYDTNTSAYITLAEVKQLVMKREGFEVRDVKTGEDKYEVSYGLDVGISMVYDSKTKRWSEKG